MSGSNNFTSVLSSFRYVETYTTDDLETIANRELGDASRWVDIVGINGLTYPYITSDPAQESATVFLAGGTIKVPGSAAPAAAVADADTLFGTDIALTNGQITAGPGGDDLTVAGVPNLKQALVNRVQTPLAQLSYHPEYGCGLDSLRGESNGPIANQKAVTFFKSALLGDPRIASVASATGTVTGDQIQCAATAVTVDGKPLPTGAINAQPY
jgi:phage baseplate assembly protein W